MPYLLTAAATKPTEPGAVYGVHGEGLPLVLHLMLLAKFPGVPCILQLIVLLGQLLHVVGHLDVCHGKTRVGFREIMFDEFCCQSVAK